jgi:hypothetical protein
MVVTEVVGGSLLAERVRRFVRMSAAVSQAWPSVDYVTRTTIPDKGAE